MPSGHKYLLYSDTGSFSRLVTDYLSADNKLNDFYQFAPDKQGLDAAVAERTKYPVNRKILVETLEKQYSHLEKHENLSRNLELLALENTFTVCTAHQPNLLTGYLYFIYKILHAIKLAEVLQQAHPHKNFVPVYYMGSEDNDLEELGTFRYERQKYIWQGSGQTGAVGRMHTTGLQPLLQELFNKFGPPGDNKDALITMLTNAYLQHDTIASATQYLVNELFGKYGLVILDPDEAAFKQAILPILKDELLRSHAFDITNAQIEKLEAHYKAQAHPRPINLFYLKDAIRERIERKGDSWHVLNTDIHWNEKELLKELELHPDRFSPNVILRGIFQESILPDVAFIGGGAEVAYWLQLKALFEHYGIFYPAIILRQSVLWIAPQLAKLIEQLGFDETEIFKPEAEQIKTYITTHSGKEWQTGEETTAIEKIMTVVKQKAVSLDPTLRASSEAAMAKMRHQLQVLEKKMLRAEKKKIETQVLRINKLRNAIYPNGSLQERVENFSGYFLQYGFEWLDVLKDAMEPLRNKFLVIKSKD